MESRYGHMVHEHALSRVRDLARERDARLRALRTRSQAERYVCDVREKAARAFGAFPRRTPILPSLGQARELAHYVLQPLLFHSRPDFPVTANLYLPRSGRPPYPAVLGLCGHAEVGKAYDTYQAFCQGLAAMGFLVLIIDPISQGERPQFFAADLSPRARPARSARPQALPELCEGHNLMGNQLVLLGDFFGSWRVWDAVRAIDYLLSRPDVDPARIGVTGNSGGGTLSAYLTAVDARIAMAAPSCFICSYRANLENENPTDAEQNPPGILASGLDEVDLLLCFAPRPTMILAQRDDYFDARAARHAYLQMRRVHELLGSKQSAAWFCGPRGHGFSPENREAMQGFFARIAGVRRRAAEPGGLPEPAARLHAAGGAVMGARVFDFVRSQADRLARSRPRPTASELRRRVSRVLDLPRRGAGSPPYRCLVGSRRRQPELNQQSQFALQSEPGIQVLVTTYGPEHDLMHPPPGEITVYVGHASGERDVERVPPVRALTRNGLPLCVVEPRGFGPTRSSSCGSACFLEPYGADYLLAAMGEMLGESYLGRRVHDVLCALDFLVAGGASRVHLVGRGLGSVIAAFAGLLHQSRPRVRLLDYLPSFDLLCHDPLANWPLSSLPRGVLRHFDLPDVYRALGRRLDLGKPAGSRLLPDDMP